MPDNKEIRRMRALLQKMAEVAEHAEQTGSFESGAHNYAKRYNAIVEHLEDEDVLPEHLFPKLDEDTDFGQLGAEAKLLADYLDDAVEEKPGPAGRDRQRERGEKGKTDLGVLVALAPFLGSNELSKLVRQHFDKELGEEKSSSTEPDLKTIVGLAPHLDSASLNKLVRSSLARQPITDPKLLVALAPHMNSEDLTEILHECFPEWFGEAPAQPQSPPSPPESPKPAAAPQSPGSWLQSLSEKLQQG